jgi:arylsulfatase
MRIQLHSLAIVCASAVLALGCQPAQEAATTEPAAEASKAPTSEPNAAAPSPRGEPGDAPAAKAEGQPNIVVIWGDDIGISNLSTYSEGLMGYSTPNIDRIAREGRTTTPSRAAPQGAQPSSRDRASSGRG